MSRPPDRADAARSRGASAWLFPALAVLLLVAFVAALSLGATTLSPLDVVSRTDRGHGVILGAIRLPRAILAALVGAVLGACGAAMQGVLRNPLADPGLVGVSSGASFGAATSIVVLAPFFAATDDFLRPFLVPAFAFSSALGISLGVLRVSTRFGRTSILVLLLAGIAINAFVGAMIGCLTYFASDTELRDLLFWMMGSLDRATFLEVAMTGIPGIAAVVMLAWFARDLDILALGEREARHLGVDVDRVYRRVLILIALGVGAAVSTTGLIGFVGLIVPHFVRLVAGPKHRVLLAASALLGAALVLVADTLARSILPPQELPIGVVTALLGAPVFLSMLGRHTTRVLGA